MAENVKKFQTFDGVEHDIEDTTAREGLNNVYTKSEADALLANKVDSDEVYSKAVLNAILDSKADEANVYSKTATDDLLAAKANAADVYTKTEADAALALKADAADVYTKTEADALLGAKANSADVYTITQSDALLDAKASIDDTATTSTSVTWSADKSYTEFQNKADSSNVYTKAEIDALIGGIKMAPLLDWANPIWTASSATDSFTATGKCYLYGWTQGGGTVGIMVNGGEVSIKTAIYSTDAAATPFPIELVSGDVVTLNNVTVYYANVRVYEERSV